MFHFTKKLMCVHPIFIVRFYSTNISLQHIKINWNSRGQIWLYDNFCQKYTRIYFQKWTLAHLFLPNTCNDKKVLLSRKDYNSLGIRIHPHIWCVQTFIYKILKFKMYTYFSQIRFLNILATRWHQCRIKLNPAYPAFLFHICVPQDSLY